MVDPVSVLTAATPETPVLYDAATGLPVILDADTFFAYAADPHVSDEWRDELVEEAACGPMRRRGVVDGPTVDEETWFGAALRIAGLEVRHLLLLALAMCEGPSHDLGNLTRALLAHPACTDGVAWRLLSSASCRRNTAGEPHKVPSILAELDRQQHPAAVVWRLCGSTDLAPWTPGGMTEAVEAVELAHQLRGLGPVATRAVDRLAPHWPDTLDALLETAAALAATPTSSP